MFAYMTYMNEKREHMSKSIHLNQLIDRSLFAHDNPVMYDIHIYKHIIPTKKIKKNERLCLY